MEDVVFTESLVAVSFWCHIGMGIAMSRNPLLLYTLYVKYTGIAPSMEFVVVISFVFDISL